MKNLILDTSVIVKWLFPDKEERVEQAVSVLKAIQNNEYRAFAPELTKYELGNVLVKRNIRPELTEPILSVFYHYPITFLADTKVRSSRTAEIGQQYDMTYYDASFVTLAEELEAELITDNIKHQGKAIKVAEVTALADFA